MDKVGIYTNSLEGVYATMAYGYFAICFLLILYMIIKSDINYKYEVGILAYFIITGGINAMLTIKIPGFSLFEIQPKRFILLSYLFLLLWQLLRSSRKGLQINWTVPWFLIFMFLFTGYLIAALFKNAGVIGMSSTIVKVMQVMTFVVIVLVLQRILTKSSVLFLGKVIIITALVSSFISYLQIVYDPYLLRIGDHRIAFGNIIRANGIFAAEYYHSYFLITAVAWVLVIVKKSWHQNILILLFSIGVFVSFQRMSWVILGLLLVLHFVYVKRVEMSRLLLAGLFIFSTILSLAISFEHEIRNSSLVKDRLSENVDGRAGYYSMVLDNIWQKPVWGFGGRNNSVYFNAMYKITNKIERATGEEGGIHNGYLAAMFYHGIPAFVFMILFAVTSTLYFAQLTQRHIFFSIPLMLSIIFLCSNLTNTLLFSTHTAVIYAIHIGIGLAMRKELL